MKELRAILAALTAEGAENERFALATIVRTSGSTYRRAGARLLIKASGEWTGLISGGCLERDVSERARAVIETNEPRTVVYDTGAHEDIVWGLGLGCNGIVELLLEPLMGENLARHIEFLTESVMRGRTNAMATVIGAQDCAAKVGARMMLMRGELTHDFSDEELAANVARDLRGLLSSGAHASRASVVGYDTARGGRLEVLREVVAPPTSLLIFGAGPDAVPLVAFAKELGWRVEIVDARAAFANSARFPQADDIKVCRPEAIAERVAFDERTIAVVMTHNYLHDREILATLLASPVRYIGMLGPRARTEKLLDEIGEEGGSHLTRPENLRRLHHPIGLDIGADTPEEIALAIVAEIQATLANRTGKMLRDHQGSIHHETTKTIDSADELPREYLAERQADTLLVTKAC